MLKNSYSHRVLSLMDVDRLSNQVKRAMADNETLSLKEHPGVIFVVGKATDVGIFSHPLQVFNSVAIDVRTLTSLDANGEMIVRKQDDFDFLVLRAKLEVKWVDEDSYHSFTSLNPIAGKFFSGYLAETISRIATLSPDKATVVNVLAAYYYWSISREVITDITDSVPAIIKFIRIATGLPIDYITPVMVEVAELHSRSLSDLGQLLNLMAEIRTLDSATRDLSTRVLSTATMYNWRGSHASEVVALGLEYPPCFIAMLVAASTGRAFKHTPLERLIQRHRKVDMEQFTRSVKMVVAD